MITAARQPARLGRPKKLKFISLAHSAAVAALGLKARTKCWRGNCPKCGGGNCLLLSFPRWDQDEVLHFFCCRCSERAAIFFDDSTIF